MRCYRAHHRKLYRKTHREHYQAADARWHREQRKKPGVADRHRAANRRYSRIRIYGFDPGDNPLNHYKDRFRHARALGYRSGLEVSICQGFDKEGIKYEYEPIRVPYIPKKARFYKPDFVLPNGIVLEGKGHFPTADRTKHLAVREDYPDLEIRFVFSNPNNRLNKQSQTTYADWCVSKGFKFCCVKEFPRAWILEPPNEKSLAVIARLRVQAPKRREKKK